ncbi:Uncharacterised protein [Vibrio cholerae]|nr:Uncharacterised protein [Vibrio cholerae]CSC59601.1 Uncharacterised protein [Vibrio cholerae]
MNVVNTFKLFTTTDWPCDRRTSNFQLIFHFIHQLHRVTDFTVKFVHEGHDRRITQTGHFHQLTGTIFNPFRRINHHQTRVNCGQGTISIFREVFVSRSIQKVHQTIAVRELHNRGGHRNTTLFFHFHPVRFCMLV